MATKNKFTLKTEKIFNNKLLQRKQMVLSITHPGVATVSKKELQEKVATLYKVKNPKCIVLFGFKTAFGGGRTQGFCLIYDSEKAAMDYEPKFRLRRMGIEIKKKHEASRKQRKEKKNRLKRVRGMNPDKKKRKKD